MVPKAALVVIVFGIPKFVWFRTLKNSARNCSRTVSRMRKFLSIDWSHCSKLGARNALRPTSPNGALVGGVVNVYPAKKVFSMAERLWLIALPVTLGRGKGSPR